MFFDLPQEQASIIKVFGIGGGGCNAVNHMFRQGIKDVNFVICNTDAQALESSPVPNRIQLGPELTKGRGAGNHPEMGQAATLESMEEIRALLEANTEMVFITAGMGGGTGTGGAPVVARIARDMGVLTVGIVTLPFSFEGKKRVEQARQGIEELKEHVDSIIVIVNDKIREVYGNLGFSDAFARADDILTTAARGIAEIITITGYVNVDFEDVKTVLRESGAAIMGTGTASGEHRAIEAVESALNSPLLNDTDIRGAQHVLLNITSGEREVLMDEISEITEYVQESAGMDADIIWGNCSDEGLGEALSVTVIATGFEGDKLGAAAQEDTQQVVHDLGQQDQARTEAEPEADAATVPTMRILGSDADRMAWQVNGGASPQAKPTRTDPAQAPALKPAPGAFEGETVGRKPGFVPYNAPERQPEQPDPDPNQISLGFEAELPVKPVVDVPKPSANDNGTLPPQAQKEQPYGWRFEPDGLEPEGMTADPKASDLSSKAADAEQPKPEQSKLEQSMPEQPMADPPRTEQKPSAEPLKLDALEPFAEMPEIAAADDQDQPEPYQHAPEAEDQPAAPSIEWDLSGVRSETPSREVSTEEPPLPTESQPKLRLDEVPLAAAQAGKTADGPDHEATPSKAEPPKSEPEAKGLRVRTVYPDGEWAKPPVPNVREDAATPPEEPKQDTRKPQHTEPEPQEPAPLRAEPQPLASSGATPLDQPPADASGEVQLNDAEREAIIRRNEERRRRLRSMSMRVTDRNVEELEGTPAYLRRDIRLSDTPHSSEDGVSRYQLGEGNGGEFKRRNNSFLHDNVD